MPRRAHWVVGLLCSRLTVQGPAQPQGASSWGSRVQSHLPYVVRGLVIRPDGVDSVRLATLLAVSHVCQGKVYVNSHIKNRPSLAPIPAHILLLSEVPTVAPAL